MNRSQIIYLGKAVYRFIEDEDEKSEFRRLKKQGCKHRVGYHTIANTVIISSLGTVGMLRIQRPSNVPSKFPSPSSNVSAFCCLGLPSL